jgi:O-methyltransferase involved in polyketide biosynthesis
MLKNPGAETFYPKEVDYGRISPTAWSVAYGRTFSDVAYAQEIFDELDSLLGEQGRKAIPGGLKYREVAVQFEARYKLINIYLRENSATQILEIASGLTPRGLEFARDRGVLYVEFDLPDIIDQKDRIISSLANKGVVSKPENLHLEKGNALSYPELVNACSHFEKGKPVAVVTEGLMRYLDFKEKAQLAKNVSALLKDRGGVWITSDTQVLSNRTESMQKSTDEFSKSVGRNIERNYFSDPGHAMAFFKDLGFEVESHSFAEAAGQLASPKRLDLDEQRVAENINARNLFVMSLK